MLFYRNEMAGYEMHGQDLASGRSSDCCILVDIQTDSGVHVAPPRPIQPANGR
jgi:hypothetical protein